ncbi:hypothetical protein [Mycolicibacterium llatzerense]|uniref:hypothetical protein n=1 Tax=Mycolicibacterium llatzerense TaxID=280871 RepID=UPI0021B6AAA2|nr:hypothetical protein [Mycolicibacterium llatzerense]MCT7370818.1 hypothetical protein [Mycolicibacterium llatzerense]
MKHLRAWFLPRNLDTLATLVAQLEVVEHMLATLSAWIRGKPSDTSVIELREFAEAAQNFRRQLNTEVRQSFSTPLESEDLFEFGEALGEIAACTYALVREGDLSNTGPDGCLQDIVEAISNAFVSLASAIRALPHARAAKMADETLRRLTVVEHSYRAAIEDLENEPNLHHELRRRELYRRSEHLAAAVQALARRVSYAVFKTE